ncbi:MAG: hypothetical protein ISR55_00295 [Bacteroidetes bacterium]|nr:hypothetical protein [Bacteroidota bacterium]MBL6962241.1 hypothetical protein [Bacteroidota bacterium]
MYNILLQSHSGIRYLVILLLFFSLIWSFVAWLRNAKFSRFDNILNLTTTISFHLQLILGLILYFTSPLVLFKSETMNNEILSYWTIWHAFMMIISIALVTIARISVKKLQDDMRKHQSIVIYYLLVIVIVFSALLMSGRGIM